MKPDKAHILTDAELEKLEQRIAAEYKKASEELTDKINAYFERFKDRDAAQKKLIGTIVNGREYTEQEYKQWRLAQIGRGKRFEALRDRVAERMTKANEVAAAYINDTTPGLYSLNRNYAAYTIEQQVGADVGFDLWDEQTVKRLIVEQPDIMPYYPPERAVKRGIDLAWGKRQITAQVTSGILQGESIKHLADRLQTNIPKMNRDSAIRAARTAVTGAQNAGRQDSYDAAVKMGIELEKQWLATLDNRTRHDHAAADGQMVAENKPFTVGGYELMYPGDPRGPGHEIYNCRCTMIAQVKGVDMSGAKRRAKGSKTGKSALIENMSYSEWAGWKQKESKDKLAISVEKIRGANSISEVASIMEGETKKKVDLSGMDLELAKQNMEQIFRLGSEYGYHFSEIVTTSGRAALGEVKRKGARAEIVSLQYPKKYYNSESALLGELRKSAAAGELPQLGRRQILIYTTTHEFAHTLSEELTSRLYGYGEEVDFWDEIESVYKEAKKEKPKELGKYAFSNQNEFLAECFSYAKLGSTPDKYADEVLSIVDKYFRKKI